MLRGKKKPMAANLVYFNVVPVKARFDCQILEDAHDLCMIAQL
jgi:hypothetical protein